MPPITQNGYQSAGPLVGCQISEIEGYETPTEQACNTPKYYQLSIEPLDYGFLVRIGCKSLAIGDTFLLNKALKLYYDFPQEVEQYFMKYNQIPINECDLILPKSKNFNEKNCC